MAKDGAAQPRAGAILWLRRDLRLADHPALGAALEAGGPVVPVWLFDEVLAATGAAARMRLGMAAARFAQRLEAAGSRLVLRRGQAAQTLCALVAETGLREVHASRLDDPASRARDAEVAAALAAAGARLVLHGGHTLFAGEAVRTQEGGWYKVYSPFWKAVRGRDPGPLLPAPGRLPAPDPWPRSEALEDWALAAPMRRGAEVVAPHACVGEDAALERLETFLEERVADYAEARDFPARGGTSMLSENLTTGEIAPRRIWAQVRRRMEEGAGRGAEVFLKELVWRDFAWHLLHHVPTLPTRNFRPDWDRFPWRGDNADAEAWRRGRTGEPFVDAAMREMFVTGRMHNRARMIVASYLTKHLMTDWRVGQAWFDDCLTDWDPASNALGWQWTAGSGPDAAPYFRIYNPRSQIPKFDVGPYLERWIAEGAAAPAPEALAYFAAVPRAWGLSPQDPYPAPVVDLAEGRNRALAAFEQLR